MADHTVTKGASAHQLHVFELLLSGKLLNTRESGCLGRAAAYEDALRMFHVICGKHDVELREKKQDSPSPPDLPGRYSLFRRKPRDK